MKLKVERNVPYPKDASKELVNAILALKKGDSVFLGYDEFNKTTIQNSIANSRIRLLSKGLKMKSVGDINGKRIWIF